MEEGLYPGHAVLREHLENMTAPAFKLGESDGTGRPLCNCLGGLGLSYSVSKQAERIKASYKPPIISNSPLSSNTAIVFTLLPWDNTTTTNEV